MDVYTQIIKNMINLKHYDKDDILSKLDMFIISNLITQEEYENILNLLENNN